MPGLQRSRTEANLRYAFSDEAESHRRCLSVAQAAEAEGDRDLAATLRAAADHETGYARGHLDYLVAGHDDSRTSGGNVAARAALVIALASEHTAMYAGMARTAHEEGFEDIADWFLTLAKAGRSHIHRLRHALDNPGQGREASAAGFGD